MNSSQTIGRSHSRKHYHEYSMDDFMKNIKKYNLRSQRYISPKPLLTMYAKNNTTNTIEKSRSKTQSNHKSPHSKSKRSKKEKQKKSHSKIIKSKLEKIFKHDEIEELKKQSPQNPAIFIQKCGEKIKKAQKCLQGKNTIGLYLCGQFLLILNEIVQKMVNQLDRQLRQIQYKTQKQIERRYNAKIQKIQRKNEKLGKAIQEMNIKAENNSRLLYELRKISEVDIDYLFGKVILGTDKCGGIGYSKKHSISEYQHSTCRQNQVQAHLETMQQKNTNDRQLPKAQQDLNQLKSQLRRHNNEFINPYMEQQEEISQQIRVSGRIRQAYDWQREAHNDNKKFMMHHKQIIGGVLYQDEEEKDDERQRFNLQIQRKST